MLTDEAYIRYANEYEEEDSEEEDALGAKNGRGPGLQCGLSAHGTLSPCLILVKMYHPIQGPNAFD